MVPLIGLEPIRLLHRGILSRCSHFLRAENR
uniref:Uncharacterized protein n=1 Tax=Siphoviridae sp. cttDR14 TaxID=2826490 RepID=A0A8S5M2L6_9CAUD|nr:MAG TPA: hypothetical protein [Siphoviridae sp. cttDR14]